MDNLYSNAEKAKAKNITLVFEKPSKNELIMKILDDGKLAKKEIIHKMFEFGITTTRDGSGIGLYNIKQIIQSMNAKIKFIQTKNEKGFIIIFKK